MTRYANDLLLSDLAAKIAAEYKSLQECLTNGDLKSAFLRAHVLELQLEGLKKRLNDLEYGRE